MSKLVPESLEEYLDQWVVEHPSYKDYEPLIKVDYKYMLEGVYLN